MKDSKCACGQPILQRGSVKTRCWDCEAKCYRERQNAERKARYARKKAAKKAEAQA